MSWTHGPHADRPLAVWILSAELPSAADTTDTFPTDDKRRNADDEIEHIRHYLSTLQLPTNLDDAARTRLVKRAKRFLIADGRLWRHQVQGRHQLYILPHQRFPLVFDAHDQLSYKGFYTTRRTFLDRFWWPSLEQDVTWFINI